MKTAPLVYIAEDGSIVVTAYALRAIDGSDTALGQLLQVYVGGPA